MEGDEPPLYADDMAWVYEKEDLVTLRPARENAWLDGFVESMLRKSHCNTIEVRSLIIADT